MKLIFCLIFLVSCQSKQSRGISSEELSLKYTKDKLTNRQKKLLNSQIEIIKRKESKGN